MGVGEIGEWPSIALTRLKRRAASHNLEKRDCLSAQLVPNSPGAVVDDTLTAYESEQVAEIAAWKAEQPGPVSRFLQKVRAPLGRVVGRAVPGSMVRAIAEKAEALVETHDGLQEIAREAGVHDIRELCHQALEKCDRLALGVSAQAQKLALMEGAAAGLGGFVTELGNIPILIAAAERAIRRIGHCYGETLQTEPDRRFVLNLLELSMIDDPVERSRLRERLLDVPTSTDGQSNGVPRPSLNGVKNEVVNELMLEAVPVLGDVASVALDYAFMRRVDATARRVFQERWLRARGKVKEIPPAPVRPIYAHRAARELVSEAVYLGGYSAGFMIAAPVAFAGAMASRFPAPIVRGAAAGARDATTSADQFVAGWHSLAEPEALPAPRTA